MVKIDVNEFRECPFCGSKRIKFDGCSLRTRCAVCFATGGFISRYIQMGMNEREAALAAWNNRYSGEKDV